MSKLFHSRSGSVTNPPPLSRTKKRKECEANGRMSEPVLLLLSQGAIPRSISHHAIIVCHLLNTVDATRYNSRVVACACLLYALKERHRAREIRDLCSLFQEVDECEVVAMELLIVQSIRQKVMLVEGCLRLESKKLVDSCPTLNANREDVVRIALVLVESVYRSVHCLTPESAARASLLVACTLLGIQFTGPPSSFQNLVVKDIECYLLASCQSS